MKSGRRVLLAVVLAAGGVMSCGKGYEPPIPAPEKIEITSIHEGEEATTPPEAGEAVKIEEIGEIPGAAGAKIPAEPEVKEGFSPKPSGFEPVPAVEVPVPPADTTYTVQKGDTLTKISRKFYGNESQWEKIFKANTNVLESPDQLMPGQVLKIPEVKGTKQ